MIFSEVFFIQVNNVIVCRVFGKATSCNSKNKGFGDFGRKKEGTLTKLVGDFNTHFLLT